MGQGIPSEVVLILPSDAHPGLCPVNVSTPLRSTCVQSYSSRYLCFSMATACQTLMTILC